MNEKSVDEKLSNIASLPVWFNEKTRLRLKKAIAVEKASTDTAFNRDCNLCLQNRASQNTLNLLCKTFWTKLARYFTKENGKRNQRFRRCVSF